MSAAPVTEAELQAYVDGALPPVRAAEIDEYLTQNEAAAQRVVAYRAQNVEFCFKDLDHLSHCDLHLSLVLNFLEPLWNLRKCLRSLVYRFRPFGPTPNLHVYVFNWGHNFGGVSLEKFTQR